MVAVPSLVASSGIGAQGVSVVPALLCPKVCRLEDTGLPEAPGISCWLYQGLTEENLVKTQKRIAECDLPGSFPG